MGATRHRRHGWIRESIPTVLVSASWVGLWLLWPHGSAPAGIAGRPRPPAGVCEVANDSVAFRRPEQFGLPSPEGFSVQETEDWSSSVLGAPLALPPRTLARAERTAALAMPFSLDLTAGGAQASYQPVFAPAAVYEAPGARRRVHVLSSDCLARRGLELSRTLAGIETNRDWEVGAWVEVAPEGRVEHVLVDAGSGDTNLDRRVEAALYRARVTERGQACGGWLRIGYGTP